MARSSYPTGSRDSRPKMLYASRPDHEGDIYEAELVQEDEPLEDLSLNEIFRRMSGAWRTEYQPPPFVSAPAYPGQRSGGSTADGDANEAAPPYPRPRRRPRLFAFIVYDPEEGTYSLGAHLSGKGLMFLLLLLVLVGVILYQIPELFEVLKSLIL